MSWGQTVFGSLLMRWGFPRTRCVVAAMSWIHPQPPEVGRSRVPGGGRKRAGKSRIGSGRSAGQAGRPRIAGRPDDAAALDR